MLVNVPQLGLAAYLKLKGATLVRVEGRNFVFESDKDIMQWQDEYFTSESRAHDAIVCDFRAYRKHDPQTQPRYSTQLING